MSIIKETIQQKSLEGFGVSNGPEIPDIYELHIVSPLETPTSQANRNTATPVRDYETILEDIEDYRSAYRRS